MNDQNNASLLPSVSSPFPPVAGSSNWNDLLLGGQYTTISPQAGQAGAPLVEGLADEGLAAAAANATETLPSDINFVVGRHRALGLNLCDWLETIITPDELLSADKLTDKYLVRLQHYSTRPRAIDVAGRIYFYIQATRRASLFVKLRGCMREPMPHRLVWREPRAAFFTNTILPVNEARQTTADPSFVYDASRDIPRITRKFLTAVGRAVTAGSTEQDLREKIRAGLANFNPSLVEELTAMAIRAFQFVAELVLTSSGPGSKASQLPNSDDGGLIVINEDLLLKWLDWISEY